MKRTTTAIAMSALLVLGAAAGAVAKNDESNGNQDAIWSLDVHQDRCVAFDSWGACVSAWAQDQEEPYGVSEGVHMLKGNGPKD